GQGNPALPGESVIRAAPVVALLVCAGCATSPRSVGSRIDPVFELPTPILFAHRGGDREQPESTPLAFHYALSPKVRADVLELDAQVTRGSPGEEEQIVVWHGPDVDNVRIDCQDVHPKRRDRRNLSEYSWSELDGKAFVADWAPTHEDLSDVPRDP